MVVAVTVERDWLLPGWMARERTNSWKRVRNVRSVMEKERNIVFYGEERSFGMSWECHIEEGEAQKKEARGEEKKWETIFKIINQVVMHILHSWPIGDIFTTYTTSCYAYSKCTTYKLYIYYMHGHCFYARVRIIFPTMLVWKISSSTVLIWEKISILIHLDKIKSTGLRT